MGKVLRRAAGSMFNGQRMVQGDLLTPKTGKVLRRAARSMGKGLHKGLRRATLTPSKGLQTAPRELQSVIIRWEAFKFANEASRQPPQPVLARRQTKSAPGTRSPLPSAGVGGYQLSTT